MCWHVSDESAGDFLGAGLWLGLVVRGAADGLGLWIEFVCDGEALERYPSFAMRFSWARCLCGITVRPRALRMDLARPVR